MFFFSSKKSYSIINHGNKDNISYLELLKHDENIRFKSNQIKLLYKINWIFMKKYKNDKWFYESAVWLPEMIVFYKLLKESDEKYISITNHYDRWAFIASSICHENNKKLNVYQHGVVDDSFIPERKLQIGRAHV